MVTGFLAGDAIVGTLNTGDGAGVAFGGAGSLFGGGAEAGETVLDGMCCCTMELGVTISTSFSRRLSSYPTLILISKTNKCNTILIDSPFPKLESGRVSASTLSLEPLTALQT